MAPRERGQGRRRRASTAWVAAGACATLLAAVLPSPALAEPGGATAGAPRITCAIQMQDWCIVASGARIDMESSHGQRTWRIDPRGGAEPLVVVQEPAACDSPHDASPVKRLREEDVEPVPGQRWRSIELAMDVDGECRLTVRYRIATGDEGEEARWAATSLLNRCVRGACDTLLLPAD